jgi:hypothetical protein
MYTPSEEERAYVRPSRIGQIVPLVVGGIGLAIIAGGALLYAAGAIGAPELNEYTEDPQTEPRWQPNPDFSKSLGVLAINNVEEHEGRTATPERTDEGSLLPPERAPETPGTRVAPPRRDEDDSTEMDLWSPPVQPKVPEGTEELPRPADPLRVPPNGYADDPPD